MLGIVCTVSLRVLSTISPALMFQVFAISIALTCSGVFISSDAASMLVGD
jgi:hypothetical protein